MNQIQFDCPGCGQTIKTPEEAQFERVKCPTCEHEFFPDKTRIVRPTPAAPPPESAAPAPPPPTVPAPEPAFSLPPFEYSGVAVALMIIAGLEFIAAPIAGFEIGSHNAPIGWLVFVSGVISGFILLGFARVIDHLCESSQRLRRIEMLIQKAHADKNADR